MGLSRTSVALLAYQAGLRNVSAMANAVAVADAESGLDPAKVGDVGRQTATWGPSVGLWQIRTLKAETGKGTTRDVDKLTGDPAAQARAMAEISHGGRDWSAWTVTTMANPTGFLRYTAAMPLAQAAAASALAGVANGAVVDKATDAVQAVTDPISQLAGTISDAAQTPTRVLNWLIQPGTWVRIAYFAGGLVLLLTSVNIIARKPIMAAAKTAASVVLPTGKAGKAASAALGKGKT